MVVRAERKIAGRTLVIETGKLARQADGAVMVQYGDTVVLVAATAGGVREGADFFPFFVDFRERSYAAGLIQGTRYDKREGRPSENEILTMRMMDRPVRPFFPDHYRNEVQLESLVLSADADNEPSVLGMIGTPAALLVSPIPYTMPIGSVRVGFVNGELIAFPTRSQLTESLFDLVISATRDKVVMIELGAREATERHVAEAIRFAHDVAREIVAMQEELVNAVKPVKTVVPTPAESPAYGIIKERFLGEIQQTLLTQGKLARLAAMDNLKVKVCQALLAEPREPKLTEDEIGAAFHLVAKGVLRKMALQGARCDGRTPRQLRPITCELEVLPRTHGSALFTRGETQTLVVTTLGTEEDEQIVRGLTGEWSERFLLHYNFPPFSVGEVGRIGAPTRRDIGHGALARKALLPVIPPESEFPYAIRVVSDVLESCASSSMASVCGGTLSLLD
ncbi:MAG: polyribonucleotide nucleotidyltransferase, partial [Planctomycetes bacterium]|nr:polyribonucleotide nucleotidyltransferase [Planctomycetota bacterium]